MEKLFLFQITGTDIIVWSGVVTTFNVVRKFIEDGDDIRMATCEEKERYLEFQK